jgi:hypothetical protein
MREPSTRSSNSEESLEPYPRASGAPLRASSQALLIVFTIELPTETLWASLPLVHGGGHTTNVFGMVFQDVAPLSISTMACARVKGGCGFSNLTQSTRN